MQANQAQMQQQKHQQLEAQKHALLGKILDSEARSRLTNIRMARPEFAESVEMQLLQLLQAGQLQGRIPMTDTTFKQILIQLQNKSQKRDTNITFR